MGSVQLNMEIGDSVLSVTLADVLYILDWNEPCFISWRKIDMLVQFRMVDEDDMITVQCKSDDSPLFIAELMHRCYQLLRRGRHNKIHTAATDIWYQAFVHSSTHFCSNATDIYTDCSILPQSTSAFFCPECAKYNCKHSVPLPVLSPQPKNCCGGPINL